MTSTLRTKSTGAWRGPIADGKLAVKVNGAWVYPNTCKVKSGGAWRDSGYVGYPNAPSKPWVHVWNHTQVQGAWSYAAAGGAPIDYYHVQLLTSTGALWAEENSDDNISPLWTVGNDQKVQIRVRAVAVNGLMTPWSDPLKIATGHDETYTYGYVPRTRPWSTGGSIGTTGTLNNLAGFGVPSTVVCKHIHWDLWMADNSAATISVYPPAFVDGADRYVDIHYNETTHWYTPNWASPVNTHDYPVFRGNGGRTGFICRDRGSPGWFYKSVHGNVWLSGDEDYNSYEIVTTHPAQGEYYW